MKKTTTLTTLLLAVSFITACTSQHLLNCDGKDGEWQEVVAEGDLGKIGAFVATEEGFNIDSFCMEHRTALQYAVDNGNKKMAQFLLKQGADPNNKNTTGTTALMLAADNGQVEIVKLLLAQGADPTLANNYGQTALDMAQKRDRQDIVKLLQSDQATVPPLVVEEPIKTLEELLKEQDLDEKVVARMMSKSPHNLLMEAAEKGWLPVVRKLVNDGAIVNRSNKYGTTPLHSAALYGRIEVTRFLLENGARISKNSKGFTPIHFAAKEGHTEVLSLLRVVRH